MAVRGRTGGGVLYLMPDILMKVVYLVPVMFIWRTLGESGYEAEMSVEQLLSYTYVNALLADLTIVETYLSAWNYDTRSMEAFTRPMPVFAQVISRTMGEWVPMLLLVLAAHVPGRAPSGDPHTAPDPVGASLAGAERVSGIRL